MRRQERVVGALVGSAVGDALGAPFEFGPPGAYTARFPTRAVTGEAVSEMVGGGGWEPGEATDDTQMAIILGQSLLACDGFDPIDLFGRFQDWARADPKDIGLQTEVVLTSGLSWDRAAAWHAASTGRGAGNGSLMRATTSAIFYARRDPATSRHAARQISALTHGDPAAGEGCAIYHDLIRAALAGHDPQTALPAALAEVAPPDRATWTQVLNPDWRPSPGHPNGSVWPTLAAALWALRQAENFADVLRHAIDLGGDTDTIAAVAGGLAGALHGVRAIPTRWTRPLFVPLPGSGRTHRADDLRDLAIHLDDTAQHDTSVHTTNRTDP